MKEYHEARKKAENELIEALAEQVKLERRILHLRQTIATLFRLTGAAIPTLIQNKGLVDAAREYLEFARENKLGLQTAANVRAQLELVGYDFSKYKNPNASITGMLERLRRAGEVKKRRLRRDDGSVVAAYEYIKEKPKALPEGADDKK